MLWLMEELDSIRRFLGMGGDVLMMLFVLTFLLWVLVFERYIYFYTEYPKLLRLTIGRWDIREDKLSWSARQIRQAMISELSLSVKTGATDDQNINRTLPFVGITGYGGRNGTGIPMCLPSPGPEAREPWPQVYQKRLFQLWQAWLRLCRACISVRDLRNELIVPLTR